jgi:hypothetical protein
VSGYPIELISAIVKPSNSSAGVPDIVKVKFFLKEKNEAFLTVREIRNRFFYWMDDVQPDRWHQGFNEYGWPTAEVIRKLQGITDMYDLGVVVRLKNNTQDVVEEIAPAIFYYKTQPAKINAYLFTLKPNAPSDINCEVYQGNRFLTSERFLGVNADTPFTFEYDSSGIVDGSYKLVVTVVRQTNNKKFTKVINFYHHQEVN